MRRAASDSRALKGTLFFADLCMLMLAWLPLLVTVGDSERLPAESMFVGLIAIGTAGLIMRYEGLYLSRLCAVRSIEVRLIARSALYTALALVVLDRLLFANVETYIRTTEVLFGSLGMLVLLVTERAVFRSVLRASRQGGARARDVLVIGAGAHAARIVPLMADHPDYGARVVGVLGDRPSADQNGLGELWLGPISDAERVALDLEVTGVVLSAAASEDPDITAIVKRLQRRGVHVQVSNGLAGFDVQRLRQLRRQLQPAMQARRQLHHVDRAIGAGDGEFAGVELDVRSRRLQHEACDLLAFFDYLLARLQDGGAARHNGFRASGAAAGAPAGHHHQQGEPEDDRHA